jgi:hypothetical protein
LQSSHNENNHLAKEEIESWRNFADSLIAQKIKK